MTGASITGEERALVKGGRKKAVGDTEAGISEAEGRVCWMTWTQVRAWS